MAAAKGNKYTLKWTEEKLKVLIEDLLDYAENSNSIHLAGWSRKQGYSRKWLYELAREHPIFAEGLEEAKNLLAAKVLDKSFFGKGNANVGMSYLPVYDKEYRQYIKWKANLGNEKLENAMSAFDAFIEMQKKLNAKDKKEE